MTSFLFILKTGCNRNPYNNLSLYLLVHKQICNTFKRIADEKVEFNSDMETNM